LVLARCYKEQGDLAAAADEYLKVCKVDVRNHVALRMLADIYLAQGRAAAAGGLYAILLDMEPDNAEIRGCAAKNKQREKGTAAEILGFKPMVEPAQNLRMGVDPSVSTGVGVAPNLEVFKAASAQQQFGGAFGTQTPPPPVAVYGAQSAPAPAPAQQAPKLSDADLNAMFIQPPEPNPVYDTADVGGQADQPGGDDVVGQLDAVFGGMPAPAPALPPSAVAPAAGIAAPQGAEPSGDDVADQLDALFGETPAPAPQMDMEYGAAEQDGQPDGDDFAGRIEALFGETPAPAPQVPVAEASLYSQPDGDDVAGQLDAIFGETPTSAPAPVPPMPIAEASLDGQPSGDDVAGQLDAIFGETPTSAPAPSPPMPVAEASLYGQPSGDDVAGQLDAIFGETSLSTSVPSPRLPAEAEAPLGGQPSGDDVADQLDELFGGRTTLSADGIPADIGLPPASGNAVVDQLDELFGGQTVLSADGIPTDIGLPPASGNAVVDQLDELFGGQTVLPPAATHMGSIAIDPGQSLMESSGNAVVDQLDELFGGEMVLPPAAMPMEGIAAADLPYDVAAGLDFPELAEAEADEPLPEDMDEAALAAELEAADSEAALVAALEADGATSVTGDDVESRLNAIFTSPPAPEADEPLPEAMDEAALAAELEATDSEAALVAALEADGATSVTGDDVESRLNAIFTPPPAPEADEPLPEAMDEAALAAELEAADSEAALAAALEESSSELTAALEGQPPLMPEMDGAASGIDGEAALVAVDEFALIVDGSDAAPAGETGQAAAEAPGKALPSSIVLDENGVDVAAPCPEDIEDRINALYGISDAETPKEDLIADAEVTGDDVEARLAEMYRAADTTTSMTVEEVMGADAINMNNVAETDVPDVINMESAVETNAPDVVNPDVINIDNIVNADGDADAYKDAFDTGSAVDAGGNINIDIDNAVDADVIDADNTDTYSALRAALNALDAGGAAEVEGVVNTYDIAETGDAFSIDADADEGGAVDAVGVYGAGAVDPFVDSGDAAEFGGVVGVPEDFRPAAVDPVEDAQDKIRQVFMKENSEVAAALGAEEPLDGAPDAYGAAMTVPDERDTPFDLPDDVLTSTLADIYYQQGQPRLALHIYERLALRDPSDARLLAKAEEIRGALLLLGEGGAPAFTPPPPPPPAAVKPEKAPVASSGRKKKGAAAREDVRPLAGVRIKKSTPAKKTKRPKQ
jgi:tetratricopeptide (TPR) repeat protein